MVPGFTRYVGITQRGKAGILLGGLRKAGSTQGQCLEFPLRAASAGILNSSPQCFVWAHADLKVLISSNIGLSIQVSCENAFFKRKMKLTCINIYYLPCFPLRPVTTKFAVVIKLPVFVLLPTFVCKLCSQSKSLAWRDR